MIYGSVCSGIEAASVAWEPLGWKAAFLSEIEAFPRAVLRARWPEAPLHGDFTTIQDGDYDPIQLLVGGTPCQSFSVAGLRKGLDDDRGNLALEFLLLADRLRPRWLVWENVPGVLSSNGGRDFGAFVGGLEELGYLGVWRVLDAQYFGLAQRRRRVFFVAYLGNWRPPAAVLLEPESLRGDPPPRREAGANVAALTAAGFGTSGADDNQGQARHLAAHALNAKGGSGRSDAESETFIAQALRGEGFDASEDGTGRGTPLVPFAQIVRSNQGSGGNRAWLPIDEPVPTLESNESVNAIAFNWQGGGDQTRLGYDPESETTGSLHVGQTPAIADQWAVRRLTPRECERLQGFPDDYTLIDYRGKLAADGPRYKALGNSMAVPVMRWIGQRIQAVEEILGERP